MIRKSDGTIELEQAQLAENRLRDEIARLHGMLTLEQNERRYAQQEVVRLESNTKELDEQVTRLFKDNASLRITQFRAAVSHRHLGVSISPRTVAEILASGRRDASIAEGGLPEGRANSQEVMHS